MEQETQRVVPLLVGYALPAPVAGVAFAYDEKLGVNVVAGADSVPAVRHPGGLALIKTVQVQEGEDQAPIGL